MQLLPVPAVHLQLLGWAQTVQTFIPFREINNSPSHENRAVSACGGCQLWGLLWALVQNLARCLAKAQQTTPGEEVLWHSMIKIIVDAAGKTLGGLFVEMPSRGDSQTQGKC